MTPRLLFIGDAEFPEFSDALDWLDQRGLLNHRETMETAIDPPEESVTNVVIGRCSRVPYPRAAMEHLLATYPLARFATLLSSLCEGEARTGTPWPACQRIYWHRWRVELIDWLDIKLESIAPQKAGTIGIVCRERHLGEGLAESLCFLDYAATSMMPGQLPMLSDCSHLFWDDSVIKTELDWAEQTCIVEAQAPKARHHWLVSAPRITNWQSLQQIGFESLHSKPTEVDSILRAIQ